MRQAGLPCRVRQADGAERGLHCAVPAVSLGRLSMMPQDNAKRVVDRSFGGKCPSCGATLPRVLRLDEMLEERTVEITCSCGFTVAFRGQGLIRDRRHARHIAPPGLDERLSALPALTYLRRSSKD